MGQTFNDFFKYAVKALDIGENRLLITETGNLTGVEKAIKKFEIHPSIISISEHCVIDTRFFFSDESIDDIVFEIKYLNSKKSGTFMNIPVKLLKQVIDVISEPLMKIWNHEVILNKTFPMKLKLSDISPIFKKMESIYVENYRPVSILPAVSKIFERIMQKQIDGYIERFLSPFLCGYRKGIIANMHCY